MRESAGVNLSNEQLQAPKMNNGKQQKKAQRESNDEFCQRLGIRIVNEKGGMEFVPYRGPQKASKGAQAEAGSSVAKLILETGDT